MKKIDTCLLCTRSDSGMHTRPISNNQDVTRDGSSWFFTSSDTNMVIQLRADSTVMLTYVTYGLWVSVHGTAVLHEDKELMRQHWDPDIVRWFTESIETPSLVLIEVVSSSIR